MAESSIWNIAHNDKVGKTEKSSVLVLLMPAKQSLV